MARRRIRRPHRPGKIYKHSLVTPPDRINRFVHRRHIESNLLGRIGLLVMVVALAGLLIVYSTTGNTPNIELVGYLIEEPDYVTLQNTQVGGIIHENQEWNGIIRIVDDIIIPNNVTLKIQPDTTISMSRINTKINNRYPITWTVDGTLLAIGETKKHITFTSGEKQPQKGDWGPLTVHGNAVLEHVDIKYSGQQIRCLGNCEEYSLLYPIG